ncbi:substrate-binding domain-containing protein [Rhizobium sp. TRM95796]|uniref:LacI family DNA-binding transcriptional regulator n=1 Tax=Rhizobium sp. TRM95796 TaxID=2979862 RepID=UPI0021E8B1B5|nr:substrate-binding domain-containing protein [Rhizobium sp. TRM95796]MCV3765750.1 substrate-binding domain-containing protein [Rhizobium sp. TRM95796]
MKPTVHDIAREAGVSLATVDRVLNRRPGVRAATRERVEAAIDRIGFVRDVAAANLAKSRTYGLAFVIPESDNSFMQALRDEVAAARLRGALERTDIRLIAVPAFDEQALAAALDALIDNPPAGVAVVAIDAPAIQARMERLREVGVAVVTLVSDLVASGRDHFTGIDNLAAGRTAGSLMGRFLAGRTGAVAVIAGSLRLGDHRDRLTGFSERLDEIAPSVRLLEVMESQDDPARVKSLLTSAFRDHPDLIGVYNLGAGNRGLVASLEQTTGEPPVAIAHELSALTRKALEDGLIDAILNQDPGHEIRSAIRVLKARADGLPVIAAQERIRIDIFLKDNLP